MELNFNGDTFISFQENNCSVEASVDEFGVFKNHNNQRKNVRK